MDLKLSQSIGILLVGLLLNGCSREMPVYKQQFFVFGTLVEVSIWGVPEKQASQAASAIAQDFQVMHRHWHAWHPSFLTDLNQAIRTGQAWTVQEDSLLSLIKQGQVLYRQSGGLFNPAIGQLIKLWGFHNDELPVGPPPILQEVEALVALAPSMDDVQIKDNQIYSHNRAVQLDFGAFAKGYAVDLAIRHLHQLGIHNAIVNAGGNLKATGKKGEKPWTIGIRHPRGHGVLAAVMVNNEESLITSGNYERYREYQGIHYSHILDPRTGMPAQGLSSVTVIHASGALADAASTALTIAGLQDWYPIAQRMGIKYAMLVDEGGTVYMNPTMVDRIVFTSENKPTVVVTEPLS